MAESVTAPTFTVMMAVGPDPIELVRVREVLRSLAYYEPKVGRLVLVDDGNTSRDFSPALAALPAGCRVEVIKSPRNGRGEPRNGGGTVTMLAGVRAASEADVGDFLIKLDTDALVIAPFSEKIRQVIARDQDAGILGACSMSPTGKPRGDEYHRRIFGNAGSWRLAGKERHVVGRYRSFPTTWRQLKLLRLVRRAKKAGCTLGENTMGGAYVVTAEAIRRIKAAGLLNDLMLWVDTFAIEDAVIPLYARMTGLKLVDYCAPGETFGIAYRGLPFSMEECVERGYGIIHSVKNDERATEEEVRAFFAARRRPEATAIGAAPAE